MRSCSNDSWERIVPALDRRRVLLASTGCPVYREPLLHRPTVAAPPVFGLRRAQTARRRHPAEDRFPRAQTLPRTAPGSARCHLAEFRDRLGIPGSIRAIDRALRRIRITRKQKTLRAGRRDDPDVQAQRQTFTQPLPQV